MNTEKLRALPYVAVLLPVDVIVAGSLLFAVLATVLVATFRHGARRSARGSEKPRPGGTVQNPERSNGLRGVTIQILNWDGKHLLAECLPSVLQAVGEAGGEHRVVVVDNGSSDGSVQFVRDNFPQVRILALDRNYGFVEGNDRGIRQAETDIVVLLNNDMIVDRHFLKPLIDGFIDNSVFTVTSQVFFEDTSRHRAETGNTRAKFDRGFFTVWHASVDAADERRATMPVFWAGGGSCAIDREKYLEVGGLDDLYHPFYVEDTDLSYRAWKRGWKCLLAPASRVVHKHRATSGRKFTTEYVENTTRRNLYLFIWKNVTDASMIIEHLMNLPRIHGRGTMLAGGSFEVRAYLRAVAKLPAALSRRFSQSGSFFVSDRDVLARSSV